MVPRRFPHQALWCLSGSSGARADLGNDTSLGTGLLATAFADRRGGAGAGRLRFD
jgi:hypothetical protein